MPSHVTHTYGATMISDCCDSELTATQAEPLLDQCGSRVPKCFLPILPQVLTLTDILHHGLSQ